MKKEINTIIYFCHIRPFLILKTAFIILSVLFCALNPAYAYEQPTHVNITQKAIGQADNYATFVSNFQLDGFESIKSGSYHEDDGYLTLSRSRHHFYDPINGQGLLAPFPVCMFTCKPSLAWGFNDIDNEYSWTKAREYMYTALTGKNFNGDTVAATAGQRNENFQLMFRSIGQVMHLVQDLAVPSHVRNDLHLPVGLAGDLYEKYALTHYNSAWALGYPTVELSQFSDFWSSPQGLAVFTNKNFISQDTNFDNFNSSGQLYYSSPQINGILTMTENVTNQFGTSISVEVDYGRNVIQDVYTGEVITNDRLTAFSVFDFEAQEILSERVYSVNDFTMQSAADILVRRAVGYSAGLLDYFFLGDIDAEWLDGVRITNGSNEAMSGTFALYYDDPDGNRKQVEGAFWSVALAPGAVSDVQTFTPPTDVKDLRDYLLVFRGQLGVEQEAVVGRWVKLNPPYAFIIEEEVIAPAPTTFPFSSTSGGSCPTTYQGNDTGWLNSFQHDTGMHRQVVQGRFEFFQDPKTITLVQEGNGRFYINDQLVPSGGWNSGDTPDSPKTWRYEEDSGQDCSYCYDAAAIEVELKGGQIIRQSLWLYEVVVTHTELRTFETCSPYATQTTYRSAAMLSEISEFLPLWYSGTNASLYLSSATEQFEVVQWAGSPVGIERCFNNDNCGLDYETSYWGSHRSLVFSPFMLVYERYEQRGGAGTVPPDLPLPVTGEAKRIYSPSETDFLKRLAVTPIEYSVIFK